MPESPSSNASAVNQPIARRQPIWFIAAISLLVIGFLVVVVMRDQIRAHWFAYKLRNSNQLEERTYYISALASLGEKAAGPIHQIATDHDPNLRILSIFALKSLNDNDSVSCLAGMMNDDDEAVRDAAGTALAFMAEEHVELAMALLKAHLFDSSNERMQTTAAAAMARVAPETSCWALETALSYAKSPIARAQAVESLGAVAHAHVQNCNAFSVLARALYDQSEFTGLLAFEREIAAVSGFVANHSGTQTSENLPNKTTKRKVGDIARKVLKDLTGQEISVPPDPASATDEEMELLNQLLNGYPQGRHQTISLPTTMPDS